MIDFGQAREIVKKQEERLWGNRKGTFYVSDEGFEDKTHYWVVIGAEEWLIDNDAGYMGTDEDIILIDKKDGSLTISTYLDDPDRFGTMKSVVDE